MNKLNIIKSKYEFLIIFINVKRDTLKTDLERTRAKITQSMWKFWEFLNLFITFLLMKFCFSQPFFKQNLEF